MFTEVVRKLLNDADYKELRDLAAKIVDIQYGYNVAVTFETIRDKDLKTQIKERIKEFRTLSAQKEITLPEDDSVLYNNIIKPLIMGQLIRSA